MFFRPKFCANCGERIERANWGLLTSRRFCPLCESEFKGHDLLPRAIVGFGMLAGVFGFGSYLKSGSATDNRVAKVQQAAPIAVATQPANNPTQTPAAGNSATHAKSLATMPVTVQQPMATPETHESQYFCGAQTKKGTACSRRVKGNIRCYQHSGMPAMLPVEKLKVN